MALAVVDWLKSTYLSSLYNDTSNFYDNYGLNDLFFYHIKRYFKLYSTRDDNVLRIMISLHLL